MSLLMQALKKAEQAKQGQASEAFAERGDAQAATPGASADLSIALVPLEAGQGAPATLDQPAAPTPYPALHETQAGTAPLDLEAVDSVPAPPSLELAEPSLPEPWSESRPEPPIPQAAAPAPAQAAIPLPEPQAPASAPPSPAVSSVAQARREQERVQEKARADQGKARAVFAAKQRAARRANYVVGGVLVVLAATLIGSYFWYQSNSVGSGIVPASLPAPLAGETPAATAAAVDVPAPQEQDVVAAAAPSTVPIVTASTGATRPDDTSVMPVPGSANPPAATSTPAPARPEPRQPTAAAPMAEPAAIQFRRGAAATQINPALNQAYQAFMGGDIDGAEKHYRSALRQDPNSRDALLGMAAIAVKRQQWEQAGGHYLRLLEADPADPDAIAGLVGLQQGDPAQSESRLKKALAQHPQSGALSFALGNLYAQQSRWSEAQQAYFGAYTGNPANADYAFNLAVSLDRLDQSRLALEYYEKALALAARGPAAFPAAAVQARIGELRAAQ